MSGRGRWGNALQRALHPPLREKHFWIVQALVVALAGLHFYLDSQDKLESTALPTGTPVTLLLIPVLYAALRDGLAGSAATAMLATLLWLPDVALPDARGHPGGDLIDLAIVDAVAVFVGIHIERRREADRRFRELFVTTALPIVIVDAGGRLTDANPAARTAFGADVTERSIGDLVGIDHAQLWRDGAARTATVATSTEPRTYRLLLTDIDAGDLRQVVFQDVTEEHRERAAVRSYAAQLLDAQEDERRRIARDIHDDPLQRLIDLARRTDSTQPSATRDDLLDVIGRLRDIARGLRPPALDQLGLVAAIRGLLADEEDATGIATAFDVDGTPTRLAPATELTAFRIVQEAVRNATRHAHPNTLRVALGYHTTALHITVHDDGAGFDPTTTAEPRGPHLGLVGMRERASLLGGDLRITSRRGHGTTIEVDLPTEPPPAP